LIEQLALVRGTSEDYFSWSGEGKLKSSVGNWQRGLKRLFRLANIPDGCAHRVRHSFAKRYLDSGVAPERLSVLMGHRNAAITMRYYAHWLRERQEQLETDVRLVQETYAR
jgi:integrase